MLHFTSGFNNGYWHGTALSVFALLSKDCDVVVIVCRTKPEGYSYFLVFKFESVMFFLMFSLFDLYDATQ
jgi:hypothetical protein